MIAIWNPKHHRQRLCLSALALEIRIASQKVTCLLWGIEMTSLSAHVFCSQALKSYVIYCVSVLEPQNSNSGMACLLLPSSGSKYSLFEFAQILFDLWPHQRPVLKQGGKDACVSASLLQKSSNEWLMSCVFFSRPVTCNA
jgi:hypothetical protein